MVVVRVEFCLCSSVHRTFTDFDAQVVHQGTRRIANSASCSALCVWGLEPAIQVREWWRGPEARSPATGLGIFSRGQVALVPLAPPGVGVDSRCELGFIRSRRV